MMNGRKTSDWYTVPNLLGYFRLLLIPVFARIYLCADEAGDYLLAAAVIGISGLTDLMDGKIARRFDQITELGKFLDPLADKLTLGVIIICLAVRYPEVWFLAGLFLIKEGFMAVMGMLLLKKNGRKLDGAKWFGKICTAVLYLVMFFLIILSDLPLSVVRTLVIFCAAVMCYTLACYIPVFRAMWKEERMEKV